LALTLPRSEEHLVRDRPKFRIGRIVYAALSPEETVMGFSFPKEQRAGLVAGEPDKFSMPRPSDERFDWVHVRLDRLTIEEMTELVVDAWLMCVPRKVGQEYLERNGSPRG
jgi:hypothetical protein